MDNNLPYKSRKKDLDNKALNEKLESLTVEFSNLVTQTTDFDAGSFTDPYETITIDGGAF